MPTVQLVPRPVPRLALEGPPGRGDDCLTGSSEGGPSLPVDPHFSPGCGLRFWVRGGMVGCGRELLEAVVGKLAYKFLKT